MTYGEKGVKWRVRILFTNNKPEHTTHSTSKLKAERTARVWLYTPGVKAVEIAEIRKVERITPLAWWDAPK